MKIHPLLFLVHCYPVSNCGLEVVILNINFIG